MEVLSAIEFRPFAPGDEAAFRELNEAWISQHFEVEDADRKVLENPATYIFDKGGAVVMAVQDGVAIGTCALLSMGDGSFEVAKMTVAEQCRGLGIGKKLLTHVIGHARQIGAKRLYLETNNKLQSAIHVYASLGFAHLSARPSPYARANVFMELWL